MRIILIFEDICLNYFQNRFKFENDNDIDIDMRSESIIFG